jgi:hypothetical protein
MKQIISLSLLWFLWAVHILAFLFVFHVMVLTIDFIGFFAQFFFVLLHSQSLLVNVKYKDIPIDNTGRKGDEVMRWTNQSSTRALKGYGL